jgi:hypothetical protein
MTVTVGQVYRDTYHDKRAHDMSKSHRTIRITEVLEGRVVAEILTHVTGEALTKPRMTRLSFKTLSTGYALTGNPRDTSHPDT